MNQLLLSGDWDFRLDSETAWRQIGVPGCWEQIGVRKDCSGPAWYRTSFAIPTDWAGKRIWLRFGAVSYHCAIFVNGRELGSHTGLWDSFAIEIGAVAAPGTTAELLVRVEKPAGLTAGPELGRAAGSLPAARDTGRLSALRLGAYLWRDLAGCHPVCHWRYDLRGCAGARRGRWARQHRSRAVRAGRGRARNPRSGGQAHSHCHFQRTLRTKDQRRTTKCSFVLRRSSFVTQSRSRSPTRAPGRQAPRRCTKPGCAWPMAMSACCASGCARCALKATTLLLNERPIYPRMALSWGWYPQALHSNPGPERVRADFARLRQLGYNGVKLCLWFPPQYYFDLADELGMLLWVELPMWLPQPSPFFRTQTPIEYARLMRQARAAPVGDPVYLGLRAKPGRRRRAARAALCDCQGPRQ